MNRSYLTAARCGALAFFFVVLIFSFQDVRAQSPSWIWGNDIGGNGFDDATGIAADNAGNVFVTGKSTTSSLTIGVSTFPNFGGYDAVTEKLDARGNVIWAAHGGGANNDLPNAIAVDPNGNSYVVGSYLSTSMTFDAYAVINQGNNDIFIVKYDPNGKVGWLIGVGGAGQEQAWGVATDRFGNAYVTGYFSSTSLVFGADTLTSNGNNTAFIVKYNSIGQVLWARQAGGSGASNGRGIAVDANGNSYVTGGLGSGSITFGHTTLVDSGLSNIFIVKYDPYGNLVWAKNAGGTQSDIGVAIAADSSGHCYVVGDFTSPSITFGTTTLINAGLDDPFIAKYDSSGNPIWARGAGGPGEDFASCTAVDRFGNLCVAGYFNSSTITFGGTTLINSGSADFYTVKYDSAGRQLWAASGGGTGYDVVLGVAADYRGNNFLAGYFYSPSLAVGNDALTNAGDEDMFITKLGAPAPLLTHVRDVPNDQGGRVFLEWNPSSLDFGADQTIQSYDMYRGVAPSAAPPGSIVLPQDQYHEQEKVSLRSNVFFVLPHTAERTEDIYWQYTGYVNPAFLQGYSVPVATLSDSGPQGNPLFYFMVRASTSNPTVYWDSNPDSGYSVDNLAPHPPQTLSAQLEIGQVKLSWDGNLVDPDVGQYVVYRSTSALATPDLSNRIGATTQPSFTDPSPPAGYIASYVVTTQDIHGNQSPPSPVASASLPVTLQYNVNDKWNLVSVPITVSDYSRQTLYASAASQAFAYQGAYMAENTLANGLGYWIKFSGGQSVPMTGTMLTQVSIVVNAGWNMIGSISFPVAVGTITSSPPGMVASNFYQYDNGYSVADSINPARGYWVKVQQPGRLILSASGATLPVAGRIRIVSGASEPPAPPRDNGGTGLPAAFALAPNFPNPFNPVTTIHYDLPTQALVYLAVFNVLGQTVRKLVNESEQPGYKSIQFDGSNLPSGIYFYRMTALDEKIGESGFYSDVKKMILVK